MNASQIWPQEKLIEFMTSVPLFKDLNTFQVENLLSFGKVSLHARDQVLFQQEDIVEQLFLILAGSIKTYRTSGCGDEAIFQLLLPGDTFMEPHIFLNEPTLVSAQVVTQSTILTIPEPIVRALASTDVSFSQVLLTTLSGHYKDAILKLDSALLQSPVERVGHYLLNLLAESGNTHKTFKLPFQKSLIAQYLGMKPETFSRALSEVRKLSGIHIKRDEITMPPFSLCPFCYGDRALKCQYSELPKCRESKRDKKLAES